MLAEAFPLGSWKSIIEMEDCLTIEELYLLINENRNKEKREHQFLAAIQGIDLEDAKAKEHQESFEEVQFRVQAELAGKSTQDHFFDMVGIEIDTDED